MSVHAANHRKAKAGERSTTISLRESKAASLWRKKNLTPRKRMIQIVCARLVMRVIVELTTNYRVASIIKQTDQITVKSVFTQESNEECERIINNKTNILTIEGIGLRSIGNEAVQTLYTMTRFH